VKNENGTEDAFWVWDAAAALSNLKSVKAGLSGTEATDRLKQYGANTLKTNTKNSALLLFLSQFKSPVTILLIIAALLSGSLGDVADTVIILIIVLISSLLGFWQERGAANAVSQLLKLVQLKCDVLRDGKAIEIPIEEVVPGDIIQLSAGDIIPGIVCYYRLRNFLLTRQPLQAKLSQWRNVAVLCHKTRRWPNAQIHCSWERMPSAEKLPHWLLKPV